MYEKITVELIDTMGSDLTVVNAARVSFNKESTWEGEKHWSGNILDKKLSDKDIKLISYLAQHNHWSPFAHCTLQFRIKAPIFVARQLQKHQVGFAWNEVSRRYVDYEPTFWSPDNQWRGRAENKKQGSADELIRDNLEAQEHYNDAVRYVYQTYELLLACGVCPEQARSILPQSMMTEWYWTGSLYGFARVCKLRLDPHAQAECREVAKWINDFCANEFPMSWKALNGTLA
jgi:thymidylate synthase (FAD)